MPVGNDNASAFAHLEQRVSYLLERLESSSDHRGGNLGRVEDGLQDILRHLENQHASFAALAENSRNAAAPAQDTGIADIVKRELSDIRFSQAETDRHTQDSLEAVHNTLGHVVDRLAMIEGDLRSVRSAPVAAPQPDAPTRTARSRRPSWRRASRCRRSRSRNCPIPPRHEAHFAAAPREFHAAQPQRRRRRDRRRARSAKFWSRMPRHRAPRSRRSCRPIIRSSRERGRPDGRPRRRSGSPLPKTPSAKSRPATPEPATAVELHCRRAPRRAGRRRRPAPDQGRAQAAKAARGCGEAAPKAAERQGAVDDHLQDSLAAGRRERRRDRARHLQDGDDAARQRQPRRRCPRWRIRASRRAGSAARRSGRQAGDAGAGDAVDDRADADRPAILQRLVPDSSDSTASVPIPQARHAPSQLAARPPATSPARFRDAGTDQPAGKLGHGADPADRETAGRDRRPGAARRGAQGRSHRGL